MLGCFACPPASAAVVRVVVPSCSKETSIAPKGVTGAKALVAETSVLMRVLVTFVETGLIWSRTADSALAPS